MQTIFIIVGFAIIATQLLFITQKLKRIVMEQTELLAELVALKEQNEKAKTEIVGKIATLEAAIAAQGSTTPEVDAALADLKTSIQGTDDIVPDAVTEEPAA